MGKRLSWDKLLSEKRQRMDGSKATLWQNVGELVQKK